MSQWQEFMGHRVIRKQKLAGEGEIQFWEPHLKIETSQTVCKQDLAFSGGTCKVSQKDRTHLKK